MEIVKERLKTEMEEKEVEVKRLLESVQVVSYSQLAEQNCESLKHTIK